MVEHWSSLEQIEEFIHRTGNRVSAFDFPLWSELRNLSNSHGFFDMRRLVDAGLVRRLPQNAVTFVENHDTDRDYPSFDKKLAYAFILTSEGYPSVFWKDQFLYGVELGRVLQNLVWIHETLASGQTVFRWADEDVVVYERTGGSRLLVGLNDNRHSSKQVWVDSGFQPGTWLHDYAGNGRDVLVQGDGRVGIEISNNSYVAYSERGHHRPLPRHSYRASFEYAGASDLDIPPATQNWSQVARLKVDTTQPFHFQVFSIPSPSRENSLEVQIRDQSGNLIYFGRIEDTQWNFVQPNLAGHKQTSDWTIEIRLNQSSRSLQTAADFWMKVEFMAVK